MPGDDSIRCLNAVDIDVTAYAMVHDVEQCRQAHQILGRLGSHIAYRMKLAVSPQLMLDSVEDLDPRLASGLLQVEHDRGEAAVDVGSERCIKQRANALCEPHDRWHGLRGRSIRSRPLSTQRPSD